MTAAQHESATAERKGEEQLPSSTPVLVAGLLEWAFTRQLCSPGAGYLGMLQNFHS